MMKHLLLSLRRRCTQKFASFRGSQYHTNGRSSGDTDLIRKGSSQLWKPTAFLGAVAGFAYYLHGNHVQRSIPTGQGKRQGGVPPAGAAIGGPFKLVNTENQVFTDQDFGGKWVLMYFGYTSSPETGTPELQKMAKTIDMLESKHNIKILPIFVTIDPNRDSTSQLKAYLREFDPRIVGLSGTNTAVRHMAQQYRVYFKKVEEDGNDDYLVEYSHNLYLIDPNKQIVRSFGLKSSEAERSENILKEIKRSTSNITE